MKVSPLVDILVEGGITERRARYFEDKLMDAWFARIGPDELARVISKVIASRTGPLQVKLDLAELNVQNLTIRASVD